MVDELYHRERDEDPAAPPKPDFWKTHRVRQIKTPAWRTRQTGLPLLFSPPAMDAVWEIDFGGKPKRDMSLFAFETRPGSKAQFIGVAVPKGIVPKAYLIVFRHSAQAKDFPDKDKDLLELGIGDYLIGRMQVSQQVAASSKDVAAVVPIAMGGSGEFETSETFVRECLQQIDVALFGDPAAGTMDAVAEVDTALRLAGFRGRDARTVSATLFAEEDSGSWPRSKCFGSTSHAILNPRRRLCCWRQSEQKRRRAVATR